MEPDVSLWWLVPAIMICGGLIVLPRYVFPGPRLRIVVNNDK